ncbi:MAG: tetratricopeptide repeat protein, partial [Acidobacteriota bacterium]
ETARVRPLTHAEAVYRLGDLLAHLGPERSAAAERHFREALRLDPSLAAAWTGLGYIRDLHAKHNEAASFYEKAIGRDRDDPLAYFLYATSIMDRHHSERRRLRRTLGGETPEHLVRARELFTRSLKLRPDLTEAYAGLGATYAFDESGFDPGIAALEKARALLPSRMDIVFNLLGLYARQGDRTSAEALMEVLARQDDPALLADAGESLLQGDLIAASRLLKENRVDEALTLLRQVHSRTRDDGLRANLDEQIAGIEQVRKTNEMINEYNRAVTLVNRKEYAKAAPILRRVVEGTEDEKLRRSAQTLLDDLERALGDTRPRN